MQPVAIRVARLIVATGTVGVVAYTVAPDLPVAIVLTVVAAGLVAGSRVAVVTLPLAFMVGVEAWYAFEAASDTPRYSRDDSAFFIVALQAAIVLTIAGLAWSGVWVGHRLEGQARARRAPRGT